MSEVEFRLILIVVATMAAFGLCLVFGVTPGLVVAVLKQDFV